MNKQDIIKQLDKLIEVARADIEAIDAGKQQFTCDDEADNLIAMLCSLAEQRQRERSAKLPFDGGF